MSNKNYQLKSLFSDDSIEKTFFLLFALHELIMLKPETLLRICQSQKAHKKAARA